MVFLVIFLVNMHNLRFTTLLKHGAIRSMGVIFSCNKIENFIHICQWQEWVIHWIMISFGGWFQMLPPHIVKKVSEGSLEYPSNF